MDSSLNIFWILDTTAIMEPIPTICQARIDSTDLNNVRNSILTCARNTFKQVINRRNLVAVVTGRSEHVIPVFCKPNYCGQFVGTLTSGKELLDCHLQRCYIPGDASAIRIQRILRPTMRDDAIQLERAFQAANIKDNATCYRSTLFAAGVRQTVYGDWFCGCFVNNIKPVPGEMRPNGKRRISLHYIN